MSGSGTRPAIGPYVFTRYDDPAEIVRAWDARGPEVAARLIEMLATVFPAGTAEHIGSTAIPGCDGKGVIDVMLTYPAGQLAQARDAVDRLGFQRFDAPGAFGDQRPVRIGSISYGDRVFQVHVHIIAENDPEVGRQRHFRDALRADPALVAAYVADKRRIAAGGGIAGGPEYADAKGAFIASVNQPGDHSGSRS